MNKLTKKEQLEILYAIKENNRDNLQGGFTDSFYLCTELEFELGKRRIEEIVTKEDVMEAFPLFTRENSKQFTNWDCFVVWFANDIERHAFLDWMIQQLEGGSDE